MKIDNITINAAFYELFESTFGEDFFVVLASMKHSTRITNLRKKEAKDLTEEELLQSFIDARTSFNHIYYFEAE